MIRLAMTGTGVFTPAQSVSNEELVASFNEYVRRHNALHAAAIASGNVEPLSESSVDFIVKASGIKSRYVMDKIGVLDPDIMCPRIPERPNDQISVLAEMAAAAARDALAAAERKPAEIDGVIVSCANLQRAYPAIAIEVQDALGIEGFGFDMNVGCSSATFAVQIASDMIARGHARAILVCSPELCTGHMSFRDRDSHFIFGDAAAAIRRRARRTSQRTQQLGNSFNQVEDEILEQYPQQFRLPQPRRAGRDRGPRQAVRAGRPQGLQGSHADGRGIDRLASRRKRLKRQPRSSGCGCIRPMST